MSAKSREREQKRRPGKPMFMQEKEEREAARKAREEKDQDVVEVTPPTSVTPGATEIKQ